MLMLVTGEMLREAREAADMSLGEMSRRIFRDKGYLSRIETSGKAAPSWIVEQYEEQLGVEMNRRGLLMSLAAGVAVPGVVADALRQVLEEGTTAPRGIDVWMERLEVHATDCMTVGIAEMQARLAADLLLLQRQLTGPRMWGVAARMMVLHGAPLTDLDNVTATARWYRSAVSAADRSEDTSVKVWVRGRSALNMAHPSASLPTCRAFATEAASMSETPSVGRLMALVSTANVHALAGKPPASITALDEARRVFDTVGTTAEVSEYTMPEWRMNIDTSLVMSRLGDSRATQAQDDARRTMPARFTRFATHLELHRGLALAKSGDKADGMAHARHALHLLPTERHSVALRRLLTEIAT